MNERQQVISDETHAMLGEFLRFRHFKRYYFEFEYDWDRLEYLEKKYEQVKLMLNDQLESFKNFLKQL